MVKEIKRDGPEPPKTPGEKLWEEIIRNRPLIPNDAPNTTPTSIPKPDKNSPTEEPLPSSPNGQSKA